jgi:hypothetical protein
MGDDLRRAEIDLDLAERKRTYIWFVRGMFLFFAHAVVILLVLAYVFSDGMG